MRYNRLMSESNPIFQSVQHQVITEAQADQRIDNYLVSLLKGLPKSRLYRVIRKGEVRVNKKRVAVSYRLAIGDEVRIPPMRLATKKPPPQPGASLKGVLEDAILYEDNALIVINKPTKLAVHGGSGISLGLIESLRALRPEARFLELVHRLDRDTSGCIMIAKKRSMLTHLHQALQQGTIAKKYVALVEGQWQGGKAVTAPLLKQVLQSGERLVKVSPEGKPSRTEFRILQSSKLATWLEARPITGRTHQIRVHCAFAGSPIVGDAKYNSESQEKQLYLHAYRLSIPLPDEQRLEIEAPLPEHFRAKLKEIFNHHEDKNGR